MCDFQDLICLSNASGIFQQPPQPPSLSEHLKLTTYDELFLSPGDVITSNIEGTDLRKFCHNANERERRRKLKSLYATLASLLPNTNNKKKQNVPAIVSRVLKYIPRLQSQIESLSKKRERLERKISEEMAEIPSNLKFEEEGNANDGTGSFDVRVSAVAMEEVVVTVQYWRITRFLLSNLLVLFEQERLEVVNTSTLVSERMVCHTVQLKVMENSGSDLGGLRRKILLLCEESVCGGALRHVNSERC